MLIGLLQISIEMAAFLALFSVEKLAIAIEIRSTVVVGGRRAAVLLHQVDLLRAMYMS